MSQGRQVRTFLFGDIEGSTRRWEADPTGMGEVVAGHDQIVFEAVGSNGGVVFKHTGDGFYAVFEDPVGAIGAAVAAQKGLAGLNLAVRMGIQTGPAEAREGDWFGSALNATARLMDAGSGGQVLVGESTEILVRSQLPEGVSLADLGRHRFRDLGEAQRVFQVSHPDLVADFPPIRSVDFHPNNLPVLATTFIGRRTEAGVVRELMATDRVVTLTGVGGVGKTRLSLAVAAREAERFPGGTWFVELAAFNDGSLIAPETAAILGLRGEGKDPTELLVAHLTRQPSLLIFDNCEHVIDDAAKVVEALVRAAPETRILATSREALGVPGETTYNVPSLRGDDGVSEAVSLFADRARHVDPGFEVDDANRDAIVQICDRLDGIPLAIELATARLRMMSPPAIAERLDDRFRLLTGGSRTALPRQRTLAAAMDWSYDLLGDMEQTLFRRLAVFPGGFSLDAVEAVCSDEIVDSVVVLDLLDRLMAASLVVRETGVVEDRYRMLETVRQYAVDRLIVTGEMEVWRNRHLEYFKGVASHVTEDFFGPDQDRMFLLYRVQVDDFRTAMNWAAENGDIDTAVTIALDSLALWMTLGLVLELDGWFERGMDSIEDIDLRARTTVAAAFVARGLSRHDDAERLFTLGFSLVDDPAGSPLERTRWRLWKGMHLASQRRHREAYLRQLEAVDFAVEYAPHFDPVWNTAVFRGAVLAPEDTPRYDEILAEYARMLDSGSIKLVMNGAPQLAFAYLQRGRVEEIAPILDRFDEAVRSLVGEQELPRMRAATGIEYLSASLALLNGDYDEIERCVERAITYQGTEVGMHSYGFLGSMRVLVALGRDHDVETARREFSEHLAIAGPRWDDGYGLVWPAALVAEAAGHPATAATILGAFDADRETTGLILPYDLLATDEALRSRLRSALPDYDQHLAAGAALEPDAILALLDRVAAGTY